MVDSSKIAELHPAPRIYSRDEHNISRRHISQAALKVLYRLDSAGYRACLVGGGVRDLLLGREPKDFDIATDAEPEQVRELFRSSRLIGRRFRLAHVRFGREIIEVATFRAPHHQDLDAAATTDEGRILRDNVYGSIDDDVWRRDFTINALYYDIHDFSVIDYVGGVEDLKKGVLRLIGEPELRYREDPVRMLRAVRFAAKLGFRIDDSAAAPFSELAELLTGISSARLFDEMVKLFHGGVAHQTFELLRHSGLFECLFPLTEQALSHQVGGYPNKLIALALANTDDRIAQGKSVTPAFLVAALLWDPYLSERDELEAKGMSHYEAGNLAADTVISQQVSRIAIPRRLTQTTREIWALQNRLDRRTPKRVRSLLGHPRFRAAYDFLGLRAEAGESLSELFDWWTEIQEANDTDFEAMLSALRGSPGGRSRRRRKRNPS